MKAKLALVVFAVLLSVGIVGCSQESPIAPLSVLSTLSVYGVNGTQGQYCTTLFAGQTIDAGTVCLEIVDSGETEELWVTYNTANGWELVEAHLWVGQSLNDMPQTNKGNPKVGNFPYNAGDITGETTYTFIVPLDEFGGEAGLCGEELLAAAHAALRKDNGDGSYQTETGWGDGYRIVSKGNWATFFGIEFICDPTEPPDDDGSEIAFGYGCEAATCFAELDLNNDGLPDFDHWGWTNFIPYDGSYHFDLYVGAVECDLAEATLVGEMVVDYFYGQAMVTLATCGDYTMTETHLYIGDEPLPLYEGEYSVAPPHYPYANVGLDDVQSDSYGPFQVGAAGFYVVGNAVVWGDFEGGDCGERGCWYGLPF